MVDDPMRCDGTFQEYDIWTAPSSSPKVMAGQRLIWHLWTGPVSRAFKPSQSLERAPWRFDLALDSTHEPPPPPTLDHGPFSWADSTKVSFLFVPPHAQPDNSHVELETLAF